MEEQALIARVGLAGLNGQPCCCSDVPVRSFVAQLGIGAAQRGESEVNESYISLR
jgi:hypothetical protein